MKRECICKHLFYIRLLFQSKVSHRYQNHSELKIIFLILFPLFLLFLLFLFVFCIFYLLFFFFLFFFLQQILAGKSNGRSKNTTKNETCWKIFMSSGLLWRKYKIYSTQLENWRRIKAKWNEQSKKTRTKQRKVTRSKNDWEIKCSTQSLLKRWCLKLNKQHLRSVAFLEVCTLIKGRGKSGLQVRITCLFFIFSVAAQKDCINELWDSKPVVFLDYL